ncbi:MAG: threo-3-hydroxy-L-aspartate ammonia-lyase [Gammaproteobacteria bacterium]|nr:threo-3-hydroxy-L-aspartate ammonia-lyase [Gammaproteobacteria bacterium]
MGRLAVEFADIEAAARRLAGVAHRTPVLRSRSFDQLTGAQVYFKCENFQRVGAFKFRGAYNALTLLQPAQRAAGVLAYSSGNHAQAVALAGREAGVAVTIVMPMDAPAVKRAAAQGYGATIVEYDPATTDRVVLSHDLAARHGLTVIPPFDHRAVIAGQGTAAMELLQEQSDLDMLLVPCGGGGLLAGSAVAAHALAPACKVVGVEPAAGDDGKRSFESGVRQSVQHPDTIADGARAPMLGELTFPIIMRHVHTMLAVEDTALLRTMFWIWERMKTVVEPTGALGAAALMNGMIGARGMRVGIILSGGNAEIAGLTRRFPALAESPGV